MVDLYKLFMLFFMVLLILLLLNNKKILILFLLLFFYMMHMINFSSFNYYFIMIWFLLSMGLISNYNYFSDELILILMNLLSFIFIMNNSNLLWLYLILEIQTFTLFVLMSKNSSILKSLESSMKYFILGALSSGFYLMGVSFLFKFNLNLDLSSLWNLSLNDNYNFKLAYLFILFSLFFKMALFPFHFWISDIYEGSDFIVVLLLSTLPKLSMIYIMYNLISNNPMIIGFSLLSVMAGSLMAMNQTKIKSLLAYSWISHLGFMILSVNMGNQLGYESSLIYTMIYLFTTFNMMIIMLLLGKENLYMVELGEVFYPSKIMGLGLIVLTFSLAGMPPLTGFLSKFFLISNLILNNYIYMSMILMIFSMLSISYYLSIIKIILFQENKSFLVFKNMMKPVSLGYFNLLYLNMFVLLSMLFVLNPNFFINLCSLSLKSFY